MPNRAFARIPNISIPKDSVVFGVYARCTAYSNLPGNTVNLRCAFVNADDPDAPTTYSALQAYTIRDDAWVSWSGLEAWTANEVYDTPDLSDTLQQVIDRDNWESGNAVILIIEDINSNDQRSFISVRVGDNDKGVILFAQYYAPGGGGVFPSEECALPDSSEWCFRGTEFPPIMEGMGCMADNQFVFPAEDTSEDRVSRLMTNWYGDITMASVDFDATDLPSTGTMEFGLGFLVYGGGPYADTIDQSQYLCEIGSDIEKYANQSQIFLFGPRIYLTGTGVLTVHQKVGPLSIMYVGDAISGAYYARTRIDPFTDKTPSVRIEYAVTQRAMTNDIWYPYKNEFKVFVNNSLVYHTQFILTYESTSPNAESLWNDWFLITDKHLFAYMGFDINHPAEKGTKENFGAFSNFTTVESYRIYNYWQHKNPVSYLDWAEDGIAPSGPGPGALIVPPPNPCTPPAVWFNGQCTVLVNANP